MRVLYKLVKSNNEQVLVSLGRVAKRGVIKLIILMEQWNAKAVEFNERMRRYSAMEQQWNARAVESNERMRRYSAGQAAHLDGRDASGAEGWRASAEEHTASEAGKE